MLKGTKVGKKDLANISKIFTMPGYKLDSICNQSCGKNDFRILAHNEDEYLLNYDDMYIIYNTLKVTALNYGDIFTSAITKDNIPWSKPVNVIKEEKVAKKLTKKVVKAVPKKVKKTGVKNGI